ncbi:MAG: hypothetical protein UY52_C0051G0003 [Parcubacteria group bacterium GW2011_GWC2_49_9]|nr:MAG: hypothetical protein UY52_C0051G0003 [Parcubacteria group bacterium GW2011_GWC2_49_9]
MGVVDDMREENISRTIEKIEVKELTRLSYERSEYFTTIRFSGESVGDLLRPHLYSKRDMLLALDLRMYNDNHFCR